MTVVSVRSSVHMLMVAAACVLCGARPAQAQGAPSSGASLVYGVSAGAGWRTTSGTFLTAALPAGAGQPASHATVGTVGFNVGVSVSGRVALLALWDQSFGGNSGTGHWGTSNLHGAVRLWLTHCVWVEGGGGLSELGYDAGPNTASRLSRFWQPGGEVAGGIDVLQTRRTAFSVLGRFTSATFENLRINSFTVQFGFSGRH